MQHVFVENKYRALRGVKVKCVPYGNKTLLLCCSLLLVQIEVGLCLKHCCCSALHGNFYLVVTSSGCVVAYDPRDVCEACPPF